MEQKKWYDEAVFYHIYPLGLTGAPKQNSYGEPEHRLRTLFQWIPHIKEIGCNAIYIGPLFESVGHGYETKDYKKLDSRLGTNADLTEFVSECHAQGVRVIFDGVFNHTGRDFFAFKDIKCNRENSPYRDWYCNVNFWGNNSYNDGFSYDNWGGYDLLVKLNQRNPEVQNYICDVIRFWVNEFDVDGIRLDAADVLDFDFMRILRRTANDVKPDFWLMGEVIHGDYGRWANADTLHSVTNYVLHKALYSGHNDHNYFEIAHTIKYLYEKGGNNTNSLKLYNFTDNHDVERIYTKLNKKQHFIPVHILLYTLPGIPSVYYGSEFGIEGRKENYSDDSLRPALSLTDFADAVEKNECTKLISRLGTIRQRNKTLSYGDYKELVLTNRQYAFSRNYCGETIVISVNNDDNSAQMHLPVGNVTEYVGALSGKKVSVNNGYIDIDIDGNSGEIWIPINKTDNENPISDKVQNEEVTTGNDEKTDVPETKMPDDEEMEIYDISQEIFGCQIYPGDPKPEKRTISQMTQGDLYNLTAFSMCSHNGTHIDAPYHFYNEGKTIDGMKLTSFVGYAYVAEYHGVMTENDAKGIINKAKEKDVRSARRILIKGKAVVSKEAAQVFADENVLLVGNESQTVGPEDAPMEVHRILLGKGIALLEGIRLQEIKEGVYILNAAPINLGGADGAPCRAILIKK